MKVNINGEIVDYNDEEIVDLIGPNSDFSYDQLYEIVDFCNESDYIFDIESIESFIEDFDDYFDVLSYNDLLSNIGVSENVDDYDFMDILESYDNCDYFEDLANFLNANNLTFISYDDDARDVLVFRG